MRIVAPVFSVLAGLYWIVGGIGYGLWVNNGPGGGVFPVVAGVLMVVFGALSTLKGLRIKTSEFNPRALFPVAAVAGIILLSSVVGLIPSLGLFMVLWLKFFEKYSWKKSLLIGVGVALFLYLVFDMWLKVPVPMGLIDQLLYY